MPRWKTRRPMRRRPLGQLNFAKRRFPVAVLTSRIARCGKQQKTVCYPQYVKSAATFAKWVVPRRTTKAKFDKSSSAARAVRTRKPLKNGDPNGNRNQF